MSKPPFIRLDGLHPDLRLHAVAAIGDLAGVENLWVSGDCDRPEALGEVWRAMEPHYTQLLAWAQERLLDPAVSVQSRALGLGKAVIAQAERFPARMWDQSWERLQQDPKVCAAHGGAVLRALTNRVRNVVDIAIPHKEDRMAVVGRFEDLLVSGARPCGYVWARCTEWAHTEAMFSALLSHALVRTSPTLRGSVLLVAMVTRPIPDNGLEALLEAFGPLGFPVALTVPSGDSIVRALETTEESAQALLRFNIDKKLAPVREGNTLRLDWAWAQRCAEENRWHNWSDKARLERKRLMAQAMAQFRERALGGLPAQVLPNFRPASRL